jgi:hypothetical protein
VADVRGGKRLLPLRKISCISSKGNTMLEKRKLGTQGLEVSAIGLG